MISEYFKALREIRDYLRLEHNIKNADKVKIWLSFDVYQKTEVTMEYVYPHLTMTINPNLIEEDQLNEYMILAVKNYFG